MNDFDQPDDFERQPPCDIDAEMAVLGSMLLSQHVIDRMIAIVEPAAFYRPAHQTVFTTITDLYGRSRNPKIDPITVGTELERLGELAKIGGQSYLHRLGAIPAADMPTGIEEMSAFLAGRLPVTEVALDEGAGGSPEGIVLRSADRAAIAKARFQDYARTLKRRAQAARR